MKLAGPGWRARRRHRWSPRHPAAPARDAARLKVSRHQDILTGAARGVRTAWRQDGGDERSGSWRAAGRARTASAARATLRGRRHVVRDLPARRGGREPSKLPYSPEDPAGEPAPHRGRRQHHRRPHPGPRRRGTRRPSPTPRSSSRRPASSCRTSPASRASSTSPRCARRCWSSAATPTKINPLAPAELVIDHSVIADLFGAPDSFARNVELEYERNLERYQFLRWGQTAFDDFKVVPPGTGIVHQVNIEYLARVVFDRDGGRLPGHPGRHRLAHHDGQRARRARLGRRRHRGRGGDARPAGVDADPEGRRLQARRRAARGRHRHRPGPHDHRDAAQARGRRQVRRVLRRGRRGGAAGQPRHDRQHEPGVRLDRRDLPDRRRDHRATCG